MGFIVVALIVILTVLIGGMAWEVWKLGELSGETLDDE